MSETKLDLDHLQAVAEAVSKGSRAPDDLCVELDPPTVLALIAKAREAERLKEVRRAVVDPGAGWVAHHQAQQEIDRLKAKAERLREVRRASIDPGVWLVDSYQAQQERDQLKEENRRLREALAEIKEHSYCGWSVERAEAAMAGTEVEFARDALAEGEKGGEG